MCNNENCEKKVKEALGEEDLRFFLDGHIDEYEADVVTVPRKEYDDLIADSTILRVVERMVESDVFSSYSIGSYLKEILAIRKPEPEPPIQCAPGPVEEDAE